MAEKLSPKQERFCQEYLKDLNATRAAIRSGYSEKTAEQQGSRLLSNVKVAERIQRGMDKRSERVEVTADMILAELLLIARANPAKAFDENGQLLPIHEMPEEIQRCIASVDTYKDFTEGVEIGETRRVKFWPKPQCLEMLGRHLKLFTDKIEHKIGFDLEVLVMEPNGSD